MNLVDSSGWLEYFADGKNAKRFAPPIQATKLLLVSPINFFEVYKKITMERDEHLALQAIALMQQATVVPVDADLSLRAAKLSAQLKLPMADSIIYATALLHNAILWTQDADFQNLEHVKYFKK